MSQNKIPKLKKYMLTYAKDINIPPQSDNNETKHFSNLFSLIWFLLRNKNVQEAIKADRFQFIVISPKARKRPQVKNSTNS